MTKKLIDYDEEFELDDLMEALTENVKEDIKNFEDIINLDGCLNREIYLGDIGNGVGCSVEGYIRFWNSQDNKKNIPIEDRKPIKLYINSGGGSLVETFTMIDAIRMSKTPVYTIAIGACYSGGFFTFITGHKRIAYPHSSFLYHEGSTGQVADAGKFRNFADFYNVELEQLKQHTLRHTEISEELYEDKKRDDWWLTAEQAIELGVADEVAKEFI